MHKHKYKISCNITIENNKTGGSHTLKASHWEKCRIQEKKENKNVWILKGTSKHWNKDLKITNIGSIFT